MDFYNQLSKFYDDIFPAGDATIKFLTEHLGDPPKVLLDVACGTGNYSLELAKLGYRVTGVDLNGEMIQNAQKKTQEQLPVKFLQGDMRVLKGIEADNDGLFCLGNSFVHLLTEEDMLKALISANQKLKQHGTLIIQIVNYDRVLKFHMTQLPIINNKKMGVIFERYYDFREDRLIDFRAVLKTDAGTVTNTVTLRPLLIGQLRSMLSNAGFGLLNIYGNFAGQEYAADSPATIVVATKT